MTLRRELDSRRREVVAALVGWLANRAFTRRTRGVDGLAKRLLATQVPAVEHDPELDHPEGDDCFAASPHPGGTAADPTAYGDLPGEPRRAEVAAGTPTSVSRERIVSTAATSARKG